MACPGATVISFDRTPPEAVSFEELESVKRQIAVESALTGHLVLATIHTNDSAGALTRLTEMGVEPFLSASAVAGILAQRLARRLCSHCKEQTAIGHAVLREVMDVTALPAKLPDPAPIYRPAGCPRCQDTGYKGRAAVYELLVADAAVKRLVQSRSPVTEVAAAAMAAGMRTLKQDGIDKVLQGLTDLAQVRAL